MPDFDFSGNSLFLKCLATEDWLIEGELYVAHRAAPAADEWHITCRAPEKDYTTTHSLSSKEIRSSFAPITKREFYQSLASALEQLDDAESEHASIMGELQGVSHAALTSGETPPDTSDTSLATRGSPASQLRNKAHSVKRKIQALSETVKARQLAVQDKINQKLAAVQGQMKVMEAMVEKLQTVVHMVNLYLGRDEEIVALRDGERAPEGTPITIRQSVLFMDEQVADDYPEGIDFNRIGDFDNWLLADPKHLNFVLPEPKGIVVLQVRRRAKQYEVPDDLAGQMMQARMNAENMKSYWLIRNGARLHRLWTDIAVGTRLIPRDDELEHFFYDSRSRSRLRPGSSEYYDAMQRADKVRQHYMRLCLVLQGILDRTQLLTPVRERINLLDPITWKGQLHFLKDEENTITDGRPSFDAWLRSINHDMRHGQRVVGNFPTYFSKDENNRITPKYARGIEAPVPYTLLDDGKGGFKVLFDRTDEVYGGPSWDRRYKQADRRGSYRVYPSDPFLICFDNATIEDMRHYLSDRRQRHSYESMIPLLKRAVAVKESEAKEEQPFRNLLLSRLNAEFPDHPCTPEKLDQLVRWWKFKTREHRALLADDSKAYRMIFAEYRRLASESPEDIAAQKAIMRDHVTRLPDLLAVWYAGNATFVALRAIDDWPVFAHQETYVVKQATAVMSERTEWIVPKKADYLRWEMIHESPAWAKRPESPDRRTYIAPTQFPAVVDWVKSNLKPNRKGEENVIGIYAVIQQDGMELRVATGQLEPDRGRFHGDDAKKQYTDPSPTDWIAEPECSERRITWRQKAGNLEFDLSYRGGSSTFVAHDEGLKLGWESDRRRISSNVYTSTPHRDCRVLYANEPFIQKIRDTIKARSAHNKRAERLNGWARASEREAKAHLEGLWTATQREKYIGEGGDPEFFEDHLKTLRMPEFEVNGIDALVRECLSVLGSIRKIAGKTLADALRAAGLNASRVLKSTTAPNSSFEKLKLTSDIKSLIEGGWKLPAANTEE